MNLYELWHHPCCGRESPQWFFVIFLRMWLLPANLLQVLPNSFVVPICWESHSLGKLLSIPQVVQSSICKTKDHLCPADPKQLEDIHMTFWIPKRNIKKTNHSSLKDWIKQPQSNFSTLLVHRLLTNLFWHYMQAITDISDRNCPEEFSTKALEFEGERRNFKMPQPDFLSV